MLDNLYEKQMMKQFLAIIIAATVLVGCKKDKESREPEVKSKPALIGKYVYFDMCGVMHTNNKCIELLGIESPDECENTKPKGVKFMNSCLITSKDYIFCPWCFTDEVYDALLELIEENSQREIEA